MRNGGDRRGGFSSPRQSFAPVNVGDEVDVKIEAVGEKGDGVAKVKGFVIFVPNVKEGDEIRVKVTKVLRKVGFGENVGPAQGPIEASEPKKRQEKEAQPEADEPAPEDSEDFGEEFEEV